MCPLQIHPIPIEQAQKIKYRVGGSQRREKEGQVAKKVGRWVVGEANAHGKVFK